MPIWSAEIKEIQILFDSFMGQFPDLEKELKPLIISEDSNVVLLYSRRCLEVIVTELCEVELIRPRKTEPLKGIIDKLNSEEKVPSHIITSMHSLNSLSTFGTHPKDFDQEQVKPVLNNLVIIIRWYLKYKETRNKGKVPSVPQKEFDRTSKPAIEKSRNNTKRILIYSFAILIVVAAVLVVMKFIVLERKVEKTIAVLPFRNDSADSTTTYFITGVMEEILNRLQAIKELTPISRSSVEQYRNTTKSLSVIARERHVNYIVEGSGQKYGDSIILRVQLIEIRKGRERHLMGRSFRQKLESANTFFNIQSLVAQSIASELNANITPQEKKLIEKMPTNNLESYDAYLKGEFYRKKYTQKDLETAMNYYQIALKKDPGYALAYSGIASVWFGLSGIGYLYPSEGLSKGYAALITAQKLDSALAEVHFGLALYRFSTEFDWESSESEFQKTFRINPNLAEAHAQYACLLNVIGRHDEAMIQIGLALKLDPYDPLIKSLYGLDLLYIHQYGDAIAACREALKIEPTITPGLTALILALHLSGRYDEALETWKTSNYISYPGFAHAFDQGYAKAGYIGALSQEADTLVKQSKNVYINPIDIAWLYICSGNKERALDYLELAFKVHDQNLTSLTLPVFDNLHNEPRYQELCRKMNLPYK